MEEAPENGKETSHSAHANGVHEWIFVTPTLILYQAVNKLPANICHKTAVGPYSMVAHPGPDDDVGTNMNILTAKWEKW